MTQRTIAEKKHMYFKGISTNVFAEVVKIAKSHKLQKTGDEFCDMRTQKMLENSRWYGNKIEPYYSFFYKICGIIKPRTVVELGGWRGDSAAHFAKANPKTTVITIDHHTDPGDEEHYNAMVEVVDNCPNVWFIKGWTTPELALSQSGKHALGDAGSALLKVRQVLTRKNRTRPDRWREGSLFRQMKDGYERQLIDILFIDSWHTYDKCKADWDAYTPLMKTPGLIIIDDVIGGQEGTAMEGVRRFWDELKFKKELIDGLHTGYPMGLIYYTFDYFND